MRPGRLSGKRALITGASRGIGRAIAERFAEEGADLCLSATTEAGLTDTAAACEGLGARVVRHAADVADPAQVQALTDACIDGLGGLDILIANAGVYHSAPLVEIDPADFDRTLRINASGTLHCLQSALRHMTAQGGGKIVTIASTAGRHESMHQAAYNASKHAVVGLTRCAALEHARDGITVNAICPGFVNTDMLGEFAPHAARAGISVEEMADRLRARVPMGRFLEAREIADLAVYLSASESDGMTGQAITISGGMRMD